MSRALAEVIWDPGFQSYDFGPGRWSGGGPRSLSIHLMDSAGLFRKPTVVRWRRAVRPASRADLERFHEPRYVGFVHEASDSPRRGFLDSGDTPSFPGCFEAASAIVGGATAAVDAVRSGPTRRAFHPAGGLHHAHPGRAAGFCIFNDIGVALAKATAPGGPYRRVAYVDIDAHHGDGVMYGFYGSGRVLDIDIHQDGRTLYPGTGAVDEVGRGDGARLKANVPLPPGAGDRAFASALLRVVPTLLREYRPELIVLQHGVDAHAGDRLAGLRLTDASFELAARTVAGLADELCEGRLVVTGGGGYDPRNVAVVLARCGFLLAGRSPPVGELPSTWRAEFHREIGRTAPTRWTQARPPAAVVERPDAVERILRALGRELGVRFPPLRSVERPAPS
jgi:acetoin utilization protein AcuC